MSIHTLFEDIRSLYFPRWDRQREWTAVFGDLAQCRSNTGFCDIDAKTIYLDRRAIIGMSDAGVRAFLIHEICHDVAAAHHNRTWARRMERAAARAEELNEAEVAEILCSDVYSYAGNGVLADYDLCGVLDYVEELIDREPSVDFATVLKRVAKYFGYAPAKVKRDFGRVIEDVMVGVT